MANAKLIKTKRFQKDIEKIKDNNLKQKVDQHLYDISKVLEISPESIEEELERKNAVKFEGVKNLWKFYANRSDRIIYTKGKYVKNCDHYNSIVLIGYADDHDKQGAIARRAQSGLNSQQFIEYNSPIDKLLEKEYENFLDEYDIDNDIAIVIDYKDSTDKNYVSISDRQFTGLNLLLNREQKECCTKELPLVICGNAGSGKTLVCLNILKENKDKYGRIIYLTYTESLKVNAETSFKNISSNIQFFTLSSFCIKELQLSDDPFMNFSNFEKWYRDEEHLDTHFPNFNPLEVWAEIRGVIKGHMGSEWVGISIGGNNIHMQTKDEYLKIDDDISRYSFKDRQTIYLIAEKYRQYLEKKGMYDDNDLAFNMIKNIVAGKIQKYDLIVVDEVQDLTELQILMLYTLSMSGKNLVLAGDPHQTINPTYFDFDRLKGLFYNKYTNESGWIKDRIIRLKRNYRTHRNLIEYINKLSELRCNEIGYLKRFYEGEEESVREDAIENCLFTLKPSENNLENLINSINEKTSVALIAVDEKDKTYLTSMIRSKDNYRIYTVSEIKGLEANYIVCYNLITRFREEWKDIFEGKAKHSTKHRYISNFLYVAITRARNYICFYEEDESNSIYNRFNKEFKFIDVETFNEESLNLTGNDKPEDWWNEALEKEKIHDFRRAIRCYEKYGELTGQDCSTEIKRCQAMEIKIYERDYGRAGQLFMEAGEYEQAADCFKKTGNKIKLLQAYIMLDKYNEPSEIEEEFDFNTICNCITQSNLNEELLSNFCLAYISPKVEEFNHMAKASIDLLKSMQVKNF